MVHPFTLTLFRHGLTLENENKEYLGWRDSPLSLKGELETKEIAKKVISSSSPDKVITSDLIRCQQTAELLFPNHSLLKMCDFREMNFGCFEGKSYQELKNEKTYQKWLDLSFEMAPPDGESFSDFSKRILIGLDQLLTLLNEQDEEVVLVVHGGVIRFLLSKFVASNKDFFDWKVPNSQGYQLKWKNIESFRRFEKCMSLSVVPSMEKING